MLESLAQVILGRKGEVPRMVNDRLPSVTGPGPVHISTVTDDIARCQSMAQRYALPGCFVVHSWNSEWDRRITNDLQTTLCNNFIVEIDFKDFRGHDLKERVLAGLEWASLVVVFLDAVCFNVAFEIGCAYALKKPLLLLQAQNASVDVRRYFREADESLRNPPFELNGSFSDLQGLICCSVDPGDPSAVHNALRQELPKRDADGIPLANLVLTTWQDVIEKEVPAGHSRSRALNIARTAMTICLDRPLLSDEPIEDLIGFVGEAFAGN